MWPLLSQLQNATKIMKIGQSSQKFKAYKCLLPETLVACSAAQELFSIDFFARLCSTVVHLAWNSESAQNSDSNIKKDHLQKQLKVPDYTLNFRLYNFIFFIQLTSQIRISDCHFRYNSFRSLKFFSYLTIFSTTTLFGHLCPKAGICRCKIRNW